jgi:hypothetical protein
MPLKNWMGGRREQFQALFTEWGKNDLSDPCPSHQGPMQGGAAARGPLSLSATHLPRSEGLVLNQNDEGTTTMIDIRRFAAMGENPLDKLETAYRPDMAGVLDTLADEWAEELELEQWQHKSLVILMAEYQMRESRELASRMLIPILTYLNEPRGNKTLRYYAFLLAAGDTSITLAHSYSELARKIGVTRAALSKAVIEMQERLGITGHNGFQKSDQARESSRAAAHRSWVKRHEQGEHTHE